MSVPTAIWLGLVRVSPTSMPIRIKRAKAETRSVRSDSLGPEAHARCRSAKGGAAVSAALVAAVQLALHQLLGELNQ